MMPGGGGYSHVKAYRDVPPKGQMGSFSPKIMEQGSHFCQKNHKQRVPFHQNCEQKRKSAIFKGRKPLRNGSRFTKISKEQCLFARGSLEMGRA